MQKRGSYFFVLDVFIASSVIVLTLIIIFSSKINSPAPEQSFLMAENYMNFLTTTQFRDIANPYKLNFTQSGYINDTKMTLDQVILTLAYHNYTNGSKQLSSNFVESISTGIIPTQYGFSYTVNSTLVYIRGNESFEKASLVLSARRITFIEIPLQQPPALRTIYGPVITEVRIWS